jgi:hypothetical protein
MANCKLLLSAAVACLLSLVSALPMVCEDVRRGPKLIDVLQVLPTPMTDMFPRHTEEQPLSSLEIPFFNWMGDMTYSLNYSGPSSFSYKELYVIQESYSKFNLICHYMSSSFPSFLNYFCSCPSAQSLRKSPFRHRLPVSVDLSWCYFKAYCYKSDHANCSVHVDPFRRSCVFLNNDLSPSEVRTMVNYQIEYPRLSTALPSNLITVSAQDDPTAKIICSLLDLIPYYLFFFILGLCVIIHAEEIAEATIFQKFFEAVLGMFFALVVLLFFSQR